MFLRKFSAYSGLCLMGISSVFATEAVGDLDKMVSLDEGKQYEISIKAKGVNGNEQSLSLGSFDTGLRQVSG